MFNKSLAELSQDLAEKKISSVELTGYFLERIKKINPQTNAFITITEESALQQAKTADDMRAQQKATPLTGLPIGQKDIFCTRGIKTSCGSKMLDNFIAPYDSTMVHQLNTQGMVMLGKTNMDEFAMGSSNESSFYGSVKNPWDLNCVPGGSSGGSAAAVAARMVPATTGTDTGGSIRQPAAFCGITGLKPTYGLVSRYGMIAFASSLDQAGPMAASAEDNALLLQGMAAFDPKDSTSVNTSVPDYRAGLSQPLKGLKVGLPKEFFADGLSASIHELLEQAMSVYKDLGVEFKEVSLPNSQMSVPVYYIVAPAECSSNLSRFDGVRFGHRAADPVNLEDLYKRSRAEGFGDEVKRRIMVGTYALSSGFYDAYYLKAQQVRQLIADDFKQAFKEVDCLLAPTTPTPAFRMGEKASDPISMYLNDLYTIPANLAGLPALSAPIGFAQGLPIGMQLIGQHFDEGRLLAMAHQYQQHTSWHQQLPPSIA